MAEPLVTMIVPFYRQLRMLSKQIEEWELYPHEAKAAFKFCVVDDGSPERAEAVFEYPLNRDRTNVSLYRIDVDVPWNRGMARNLGTKEAKTPWVLHVDTDHILPADSAAKLVEYLTPPAGFYGRSAWYRFKRYRVGAADFTRKKDKVPDDATFVEIHPHIDSYLCRADAYWRAGGYNQKFAGVLGGGSPFLKEMEKANGPPVVLDIPLHVYTSTEVPDSSVKTLSRDPAAFKKRKQELMAKYGTLKGTGFQPDLPWHRVF